MAPSTSENNSNFMDALLELGRKLDTLISSLPGTYITRVEHDHRFAAMELVMQTLRMDLTAWQSKYLTDLQKENDIHTDMSKQVQETERRILDKIDTGKNNSRTSNQIIGIAICGWVIAIASIVVTIFLSIHH